MIPQILGQGIRILLKNILFSKIQIINNTMHLQATFFMWLYEALVSANVAPQASTIFVNITRVSRRVGCGGKTGTATIPALRQATNAMMKSREGGNTKTALFGTFN